MSAATNETLLTLLESSRLLPEPELAQVRAKMAEGGKSAEPRAIVDWLVERSLITRWQASEILVGRREFFLGKYKLLDRIGTGGMGTVFKAQHTVMSRTVALKVMANHLVNSPTAVARFQREVKAAAALNHPNIITAYDADCEGDTHFLVMEYVAGRDLGYWLKERGRIPIHLGCECIRQTALGLQHAHEHGLVHRDIKPSNLLVTQSAADKPPVIKILDMGLARFVSETKEPGWQTQSGQIMGTPDYIAPEQAEDAKHADIRADIFSLGCTLFHLLTGQLPFRGDSVMAKLSARLKSEAPSVRTLRPEVPPELEAMIAKMLARDPAARPQTPEEIATTLIPFARKDAAVSAAHKPTESLPQTIDFKSAADRNPTSKTDAAFQEFLDGLAKEQTDTRVPGPTLNDPAPATVEKRANLAAGTGMSLRLRRTIAAAGVCAGLLLVVVLAFKFLLRAPEQIAQRDGAKVDDNLNRSDRNDAGSGRDTRQPPEAGPLKQDDSADQSKPSVEQPEPQPSANPASSSKGDTEPSTATPQPGTTIPPETTVIPQKLAVPEIENELEAKYREALGPVEALIAAWDFGGALAALENLSFEEPALAEQLAHRLDEVGRMARLKERIIAKINDAKPPLKTSELQIRGIGGQVTKADTEVLMLQRSTGKTSKTGKVDTERWSALGGATVKRLIELVIDAKQPDDCLAAGLLALVAKDAALAEAYFDAAAGQGSDVGPFLGPLAAANLAQANALLEQKRPEQADQLLNKLEQKYGATPWLAAHKASFEISRQKVKAAIFESEAEKLYAQAAELFKKKRLFEMKPLVEKLKTDYAASRPMTDPASQSAIAEMQNAVADLGQFITVRQDGKGDFKLIQAAIDSAPPKSVIEIQDNGPYNEKLVIPASKAGLTLRGKEGFWPIITSVGTTTNFPVLVDVQASAITIEHVVLAHNGAAGSYAGCVATAGAGFVLRSAVVYAGAASISFRQSGGGEISADNCVITGRCDALQSLQNSLCLAGLYYLSFRRDSRLENNVIVGEVDAPDSEAVFTLRRCTITKPLKFRDERSSISDCIVPSLECPKPGMQIEHCDVHDKTPFIDQAKPGKGCFAADPQFVNPQAFDYRLKPTSPCRGKASDGGDVGCRYTPEMLEMLKLALDLRARGIIDF
jgi:serine/threonine protein kinase